AHAVWVRLEGAAPAQTRRFAGPVQKHVFDRRTRSAGDVARRLSLPRHLRLHGEHEARAARRGHGQTLPRSLYARDAGARRRDEDDRAPGGHDGVSDRKGGEVGQRARAYLVSISPQAENEDGTGLRPDGDLRRDTRRQIPGYDL